MKAASFKRGRAWIELSSENLCRNVAVLRNLLPEKCELMPSVKANAHGHGAVEICRLLNKLGIRAFCVATVMEGVELRKRHINGEILVFGYTHLEQFPLLRRYRLIQTVVDHEYAEKLNSYGKKLEVHVKVDTGMNRLGESSDNICNIVKIFGLKNLAVTGIYSHFCAQNDEEQVHKNFTQGQLEQFSHVLGAIKEHGYEIPKIHLQGSYGIFSRPDLVCDLARPGMALYGVHENANPKGKGKELRPVLSLKARVSAVKTIQAGETVGYGLAFIASHEMKIAALAIGYADGLPRALSCGIGHILIGGSCAPVIGTICMDQTMIDVTGIEGVKQGDVATIIGRDGKTEVTAYDIAEYAGTIPNEILGRLGSRLERIVV